MNRTEIFIQALKQAGHRITAQRQAICEFLAQTNLHPTPAQVYQEMAKSFPGMSQATVYNTLNTLQQLGLVIEMNTGDEHTHYETDTTPHVNLICLGCQKIIDYSGPILGMEMRSTIANKTGFQSVVAKCELYGFCQECQTKKRAEIRTLVHRQSSLDG